MAAANKPSRIALMLPRFSRYGGVEGYAYSLAGDLAARGHAVDVICARRETEAPEGVRIIEVGRPFGVKVVKMLWFLIRAEQVRRSGNYDLSVSLGKTWNQDIARVGGGPLPVFWRLSREAWEEGWPRLIKQFSRLTQPANWLTRIIENRMFSRTPRIVAISDSVREWVIEAYPKLGEPANSKQKLLTIYNCPDVSRFSPPLQEERDAARQAFGIKGHRYVIGLATTNFALKGVAPLIRSLALLPEDTELLVAGGRNPQKYLALAASRNLETRVRFLGKVSDMRAFYHALDMFALPSFYDTLGNVVLEALSCGVKTLCSRRAGASAFLSSERIIIDPSDPVEIAEKVAALRACGEPVRFVPKGTGTGELIALAEHFLESKERAA